MNIDCGYCQQPIANDAECCMIEDDYSAWFLHPACYDKHIAECEAEERVKLEAAQNLERQDIAAWNALSKRTA